MRLTVVIGFVLAMGTHAWAGLTCDDYPDAIFCEDFDSYCKDPGPYTPCPSGIANNHNPHDRMWSYI
jgi:hypothetical protein